MKVNFTPQQIKNLLMLLNRVQLRGDEAIFLVEIQMALQKALQEEAEKEKENKEK